MFPITTARLPDRERTRAQADAERSPFRERSAGMISSSMSPAGSRRREHRSGGGRFRAEIEMDRGVSLPRSPELGFAAAVREPLVRLKRPKYDFEMWDWGYFSWPHDRLDANLEMRDSDPRATFEADRKVIDGFLSRSTLQIEASEGFRSRSTLKRESSNDFQNRSTVQPESGDNFRSQSTLQLESSNGFRSQSTPKLEIDDGMPFGGGALRRWGCAESNPFLLGRGEALLQGPCAY